MYQGIYAFAYVMAPGLEETVDWFRVIWFISYTRCLFTVCHSYLCMYMSISIYIDINTYVIQCLCNVSKVGIIC